MYDLKRLNEEYKIFISRLIYEVKNGQYYFNKDGKSIDKNNLQELFNALNLLTVDEFNVLLKDVQVDAIDFWDNRYLLYRKNPETSGTKLNFYSKDPYIRTMELSNSQKYFRYTLSTFNPENKRKHHIEVSQLYPDGIYVLNDDKTYFISMETINNCYEEYKKNATTLNNKTYEEYIDYALDFAVFDKVSPLYRNRIMLEGPQDENIYTDDLNKYNEIYRIGLKEYYDSHGFTIQDYNDYDYKPIQNKEFESILEEVSSFTR